MQFWREHNRPIIYSLSPGTGVTPTMAKEINDLVNMYRITGDDWDSWQDVTSHFDISRCIKYSSLIFIRHFRQINTFSVSTATSHTSASVSILITYAFKIIASFFHVFYFLTYVSETLLLRV